MNCHGHSSLVCAIDSGGAATKIDPMKSTICAFILMSAQFVLADPSASLYEIPLKDIDGKATSLKKFQGKVMLIVNVASECGNTAQYGPLEALYQKYQAKGLFVLGFPCNDFGGQEPGSPAEIKNFCAKNYSVTFPMFAKVHAKGDDQHPLYAALTGSRSPFPGEVTWNFGKFLVGRDGRILQRFDPDVAPDSDEVVKAIEAALAAK